MQSVSLKCSCIYCLKLLNFTLTEYPLQKLVFTEFPNTWESSYLNSLSKPVSFEHTKVVDQFHRKSEAFKRRQT